MQEIFAKIIAYNFCRRIAQSVSININSDDRHKWKYRINFTMAVTVCLDFLSDKAPPRQDTETLIRRYIEPIRPNRADRRKVVPKKAVYFNYRVA